VEDRRIIKTKKTIKSTLIGILQEMPFEKITVTEICSRGIISRITFYTHYEDKYVLAEELFSDYIAEADDNYHRLQSLNNPRNHAVQGYVNLLEAILKLFYDNYSFFSHTTAQENPYLYSLFFYKVFIAVDDYLRRHRGVIPQFPRKQTAALLCNGMFGVINTCIADNMPEEKVRQMAHEIYQRLLKSELFHTVDEK
jgi:AcrR family transcriptional regulator